MEGLVASGGEAQMLDTLWPFPLAWVSTSNTSHLACRWNYW